jgi:uncharacterized protein YukE
MTSFAVNHHGMGEVNDGLSGSLQQMRSILGQLDTVLRTMPQAAGGQAVPLWDDKQRAWHGACDDMDQRLGMAQRANVGVASAFYDGDNAGARIML